MTGMDAAASLAAIGCTIGVIGIPICVIEECYKTLRALIVVTAIFILPLVLRLYAIAILE